MLPIIVAFLLFVATLVVSYVIWYAIRGRRLRERDAALKAAEKKGRAEGARKKAKSSAKGKWGVGKDSYCYPGMNDVMGYEFISVVKVDENLTNPGEPETKKDSSPAGAPGRSWDNSTGIGLTTVPTEDHQTQAYDGETDVSYPESNPDVEKETENDKLEKDDLREPAQETEFVESELNRFIFGGWSSNDEDDGGASEDDLVISAMNNSGNEMFEEPGDCQETVKRIHSELKELTAAAPEYESMVKSFQERDTSRKSDSAKRILQELDETNVGEVGMETEEQDKEPENEGEEKKNEQ
jgi:hypothetical protein